MSGHVQISGATVLVTGATGGIGQAIARALKERGASLVLTGRRTDVLEPLAAETGGRTLAVDLSDRAAVAQLAVDCADVDVVVANAALPGSGPLVDYTVDQIDRALDVNLRAPMILAHALAPRMLERGRGQFVFISSLSGKSATPGSSIYSATKFGLRGFALGLRGDMHGRGVGVTTVFPGFIRDAGMFAESGVQLPSGVGTRTPEEVAAAVVKAIENDPPELDVAPLSLRAGAAFAGIAPGLSAALARKLGSEQIAAEMGEGQRSKR